MAKRGTAMGDGSYPIGDASDVEDAVKLAGKSKTYSLEKVKAHIVKRAKALGCTDKLPDEWKSGSMNANRQEGGEHMPDDDVLELTQDELDAMIAERAEEQVTAALRLNREQDAERFERLELEAREARVEAHKSRVDTRIRELQDAGHTPALLKVARQLMLADAEGDTVATLNLSDDDGDREEQLSLSAAVELLLGATQPGAVTRGQPNIRKNRNGDGGEHDYDPKERAKQLLEEARNGAVVSDL